MAETEKIGTITARTVNDIIVSLRDEAGNVVLINPKEDTATVITLENPKFQCKLDSDKLFKLKYAINMPPTLTWRPVPSRDIPTPVEATFPAHAVGILTKQCPAK